MTSSSGTLSSCSRLKNTSALSSVPALLDSTPGVSRNRILLRSFFSATIRFSRRYCASTGAGTPYSLYSPVCAVEARRQQRQLVGIGHGIARRDMAIAVPRRVPGASCQ